MLKKPAEPPYIKPGTPPPDKGMRPMTGRTKNAFAQRMGACVLALTLLFPLVSWGQSAITPLADTTVTSSATLIRPNTGNRYALNCTNNSSSVNVRWGSLAVTASTGQQLKAGASIEIHSIGPIYMISEGASVTVSCTEESK